MHLDDMGKHFPFTLATQQTKLNVDCFEFFESTQGVCWLWVANVMPGKV